MITPDTHDFLHDERIVLTLDAGGTSFRFSAMRSGELVTENIVMPSHGDDLERCIGNIVQGFARARALCERPPVAISFAFPGPAAYPSGVIGDLTNLPAFRGGVPLGPMLEEKFGLPVFINNDGDLFAYGEAMIGMLPQVNRLLAEAGNPKRFRNLIGLTLGTGFGAGLVRDGELVLGDNSVAGEIWLLRNKRVPSTFAEEGASIRAVRRSYAQVAGIAWEEAPEPKDIAGIAAGEAPGNREAAIEAFRHLGEVVGDALANTLTLFDGLAVIGGGLSGAAPFFLPTVVAELNGTFIDSNGAEIPRLIQKAFNLEDAGERAAFCVGAMRELPVPGTNRRIPYDPLKRVGVGISQLGTSRAIATGAYAFALNRLDHDAAVAGVAVHAGPTG